MLTAIAALLLGTAQAEPLDPDLACVVDRISAESRASILDEAASGQGGPVRRAFRNATAACAEERSWTEPFARGIGGIAAALVVGEEALAVLERGGISIGLVDDWFDAQPREVQTMAELEAATIEDLIRHLTAEGVTEERLTANAHLLGLYLGSRQQIERIGAGLTD